MGCNASKPSSNQDQPRLVYQPTQQRTRPVPVPTAKELESLQRAIANTQAPTNAYHNDPKTHPTPPVRPGLGRGGSGTPERKMSAASDRGSTPGLYGGPTSYYGNAYGNGYFPRES